MKKHFTYLLSSLFLISSCASHARLDHVEKKNYPFSLKENASIDSSVWLTILPYKLKLDTEMNVVVGTTKQALSKDQPEGLLGNFVADLCLEETRKHYQPDDNKNVDFCFLNNGGLRAALPEGKITRRNIFEVMPFENELIILAISGYDVSLLLNYMVSKGGIPVSGLRFKMKDNKAFDVVINNAPFDSLKTYKVVTSDYLANGGDNLFFLAAAKQRQYVQLKLRDAILQYCEQLKAEGKIIDPKLDNRISHE